MVVACLCPIRRARRLFITRMRSMFSVARWGGSRLSARWSFIFWVPFQRQKPGLILWFARLVEIVTFSFPACFTCTVVHHLTAV